MATMSIHTLSVQITCAVAIIVVFLCRRRIRYCFDNIASRAIHLYLVSRYPVKHVQDSSPLPSCQYEWPNGQGDAEKFLHGQKNSELWERQHGAIYRLWSGMAPEVVVTKPEHVSAVFRDSDKHFKAENNNSGYLMSQILGRCVGLISRDDWKRVRSVTEQPFHRSTATAYVPLISRRVSSYYQELWETRNLSRGVLDPADDLKLLPFLIVAEIVYGSPLAPDVERELRALAPQREALFKHVIAGGLARFSWSKYLPTRANRELAAFQKRWLAFNELAHQSALEKRPSAPIVSFFNAREAGQITTAELLHTLDEMLYANLDVTAGGMSWNVVFLAAHRDIQIRLRKEISEKRAENGSDGELPDSYMLSSSTLLAACISESARIRPLAAFSVPQAIPTARVIGGYQFPAMTNFVIDSYALNIRNPYWGEDRALYKPDRFLARDPTKARYNYWRYGFGPRQCMGKYVADLIIREILVQLVSNYDLKTEGKDAKEWDRNGEVWIDHPDMRVSCVRREQ